MKLETFSYIEDQGWSVPSFPELDSEKSVVIVCGAPEFMKLTEPIDDLTAAYPYSHILGCSTSGEIFGTDINDKSLSVAVMQFRETTVRSTWAPVSDSEESFCAGEAIARSLHADSLRGIVIFSDGLHVNGSELVRGINSILPPSVIVTGGLAGDGERFQETWVIHEGKPQSGLVSAFGLYGDRVHIGHGSKGGWDIFGPERTITKSKGNVLYELDGRPALEIYTQYLGERAAELPAAALLFPLAVRASEGSAKQIVRTILSIDEESQTMTFAGDVPEGSLVQMMKANCDRLVHGASEAAIMSRWTSDKGNPTLSLAISCVGRRLVLGERAEEELDATMDALPANTHQIGYYSYGEISPYTSGHCDLHNQTMTLTTVTEE